MKYGVFNDTAREYVIATPKTPLPWINYLGSRDFFRLISNTAGGYCFYKDAKLLRLTRYRYNENPLDVNGHYFYVRDNSSVWNIGWQPVRAELDRYRCRHGLGYTILESAKDGLACSQETFVPVDENCELTRVTLTNESDAPKQIDLFSAVEFCLWNALDDMSNFQRNYSIGEVEVEGSRIYHKSEYRERRNHYAVFSVNAPVDGFDTDRTAFCGAYRSFSDPEAVFTGESKNSIAHGWQPIGSHHIRLTLAPGESKRYIFTLGYLENPVAEKFIAPNVINKAPSD
ncbi:MAG: glycosyl transferase, partial [Alphaproteobacteria bacterium]|nr:glycosyl transferase [Alphaproteobacteria bacterium]